MSTLKDVFGQEAKVGDKIAAGMAFNRSSVLRVGEIIAIKEGKVGHYSGAGTKWSIRVKWTHNRYSGDSRYYDVKESTIKVEEDYSYAKFVILPPEYVAQFPSDIKDD